MSELNDAITARRKQTPALSTLLELPLLRGDVAEIMGQLH